MFHLLLLKALLTLTVYLLFSNSLEQRSPFLITEFKEEKMKTCAIKEEQDNKSAEITGRWTRAEHQKFLEALGLYGRNWKMIQEYVGTRSATQARSHAQKYFAKLQSATAEGRTQETTSVASPIYKPVTDSVPPLREPVTLKRKLRYSDKLKAFRKTEPISTAKNRSHYKALEKPYPRTIVEHKWANEQYLLPQLDYSTLAHESYLTFPQELEINDFHLEFLNLSTQAERKSEEIDYPETSLLGRYPSLSSLFE